MMVIVEMLSDLRFRNGAQSKDRLHGLQSVIR